ncbi:chitobiase/beta-hexosaminidase C-terminal domain-containing protein [Pseudoduganella albidiflava]|nr:chitobiase/beta-hexosaminidase C-terminal domain-containing protein [Pseudoduganella albidiflava]GGY58543.1 hypothetical protein GCM10007387_46360 [Pseudoduganella albidiflava]
MNQFPRDFPHRLTGFGGDPSLDQAAHRERCRKCPVILLHGNASHSAHPRYGMAAMQAFLKDAGYQDCEIWCCDYLGENNTAVVLPDVHRDHIDAVRSFIDDVRAYLGVQRVDFIAHSLGCGMVNGYLRGLQANGEWNNTDHRLAAAGTFVSIAGAQYGLGPASSHEFRTGSQFEILSHRFGDVAIEDTPSGENDSSRQIAPVEEWKGATAVDDDQVSYVAVIARGDFVDQQHRDTSRRQGADLNKVVNVGMGTDGHEKVIKNQPVFNAFRGYLNRYPPAPPVVFSVDKESGSHGPDLQVTVTVSPAGAVIGWVARRLTKAVDAGFLTESVAQTQEGALADGQSLTLAQDGAWEVTFTASNGATLERAYGVNVTLPEVTILTPDDPPFEGSLEVRTAASKGTVFHSTDRTRWLAQSNPVIHETTTLYFIAIDADGLASPVVSRTYEKKVVQFVKATLTEHFLAQRLDVFDYVALTLELGGNAVIILYFIDGDWVRDPGTPAAPGAPDFAIGIGSPAPHGHHGSQPGAPRQPEISCDKPAGVYPRAFHATISVPGDGTLAHYTDDGSDPSDAGNPQRKAFDGRQRVSIRGNGHHALLCHAKDHAGHEALAAFGWRIDDGRYPETWIAPSAGGHFAGTVRIELCPSAPCAWTRYTLDGSEPSATHGEPYTSPIVLDRSARLRFRSCSPAGKLEPVKSADFTVRAHPDRLVFASDARGNGTLVARPGGEQGREQVLVGTGSMLRIGSAGGESRAILQFDTSALPDNAVISHACLEMACHARTGDPWAGGRVIRIDVQRGHFGASRTLHGDDWHAAATAENAAQVGRFTSGTARSGDFSAAGLAAIHRTGVTHLRLRLAPVADGQPDACLLLAGGRRARLHVTLAGPQAIPE